MNRYTEDLGDEDKSEVIGPIPLLNTFSLSNNHRVESEGKYIIPVKIKGTRMKINLDDVSL